MLRMITISIEAEDPAEQGVRPGYHDPHDVHDVHTLYSKDKQLHAVIRLYQNIYIAWMDL